MNKFLSLFPWLKRRTREEHLEWCKQRAWEALDEGNVEDAFVQWVNDMQKHPETGDHPNIMLAYMMLTAGVLNPVALWQLINEME